MLQNILKFTGVKELKRETQKSINGGFNSAVCPGAGDACNVGGGLADGLGAVPLPCLGDVEELICVRGVWVLA